jgi:hypothetical protein
MVNLRDSKATGRKAPASSGYSRMAETAKSEASVSRSVGRAGSHTRSTGAEVSATLSASTLRCLALPKRIRRAGCREPLRGWSGRRSAARTCCSS